MPLKKFMMDALKRFRKGRAKKDQKALSSPSAFNAAEKVKKRKERMAAEMPK